ncbi:MAG: PD-(D/E)XK nuclease family protein, partial [Bacteroidia bacterium]
GLLVDEIDRYLADAGALYTNLHNIKEIENWSLAQEELSDFQKNYLEFMKHLGKIYTHFTEALLTNNESYQGLAYRAAVKHYEDHPFIAKFSKLLFCGFNALNQAETIIFSALCKSGKAEMLWDADHYYLDDPFREAGLFLRRNLKTFGGRDPQFIGDYFKEKKNIEVISVPKQMGQAQTVSVVLKRLLDSGVAPDQIAIVLANEKLLWPVLKLLPASVEHVNITMEYPIRYTAAYNCIELLLKIHLSYETQSRKQKHIYYADVLSLLRHPFFNEYLESLGIRGSQALVTTILDRNYAFITPALLKELYGESYALMEELFEPWKDAAEAATVLGKLLQRVKDWHLSTELNNYKSLELEYLHVLIKNFNRVSDFVADYEYFRSLKSFKIVFNQVVATASAAFIGEPLRGLQIMGVLETRTLDFENVIFVSVNEGVLPSGKSMNSFIPNDLKRYYGLPLYGDKDAIYAYHFYRLLQRSKNTYITFDSETDTFGKGEKSRFVSQLLFELPKYNPETTITESIAVSGGFSAPKETKITIAKSKTALQPILDKALSSEDYKSLSPSALITYKQCSLKFYFRYGVGLKEPPTLEESAEANTFGSILHESLEQLYKPYVNRQLTTEDLKLLKPLVSQTVETRFLNYFSKSEAFFGKNLLQQKVLKVYVEKLLDFDVQFISTLKNKELNIVDLEKEMTASLMVTIDGQPETVYVKGTADRIDRYAGTLRIVDYKSSVHQSDKFEFVNFEELFGNKDYDKMLQLFLYAWLASKNGIAKPEELKPCIIPFKKFEKEPRFILRNRQPLQFDEALLNDFEQQLAGFISGILSSDTPFIQTEDEKTCEFCAYRTICGKS